MTAPEPTQPRPTSGTYPPPVGALAPHAAYDNMFGTPEMTACDGGEWECLPDR